MTCILQQITLYVLPQLLECSSYNLVYSIRPRYNGTARYVTWQALYVVKRWRLKKRLNSELLNGSSTYNDIIWSLWITDNSPDFPT